MEQNDSIIIQVLLSKSLCQRRLYSEGISGMVSQTKTFHLSTAGKLFRLRCKTEGVLTCGDLSQELFLPLGPVSQQGRWILSYSLAKKTLLTFECLVLPGSLLALKAPWSQVYLQQQSYMLVHLGFQLWLNINFVFAALGYLRLRSGASVFGGPLFTSWWYTIGNLMVKKLKS